jgi:hypothetical protein
MRDSIDCVIRPAGWSASSSLRYSSASLALLLKGLDDFFELLQISQFRLHEG